MVAGTSAGRITVASMRTERPRPGASILMTGFSASRKEKQTQLTNPCCAPNLSVQASVVAETSRMRTSRRQLSRRVTAGGSEPAAHFGSGAAPSSHSGPADTAAQNQGFPR
jgi:hypothetical protein